MNQKENNFEELQQLLKLKQQELPPPGYFDDFSGQVIARIRAGEAGVSQAYAENLQSDAPWVMNFLRLFETRPGLIGGFAASLCLLLVLGVIYAEHSEVATKDFLTVSEPSTAAASPMASIGAPALVAASESSGIVASTNPVTSLQPVATLFAQPATPSLFQSVSFASPGQ